MNASAEPRHAIVPESAAGRRLDAVVAELFPEYSRSRLSAWIKSGDVSVDGAPARGRDPVRGGEQVALNVVQETQTHAVAEDIPLDVLYEDEHVFVIDKPAGLVVHPGAGNPAGTLVNALLFRDPALELLPRAGIVHRLDKDTSGVMVVARTLTAHTALVEQLSNRQVHRQYMAVREDGKDAVTHYRLRERFRAHTALECRLETGRTHQIRVHMQHLKHPIVGDPLYGGSFKLPKGASEELIAALRAFKRQALHAEVLEFMHPASGEPIRCSAPLPADMQQLLALLRADAAAHAEAERARR